LTDYPTKGEDQKIVLSNSNFSQFDRDFAERLKEEDPEIWKAGGNIRGNEAFALWGRARSGDEANAVTSWIKEREAWAARHLKDGGQFPGDDPTLSNVAGIVAAIKWGVILQIGESTMKSTIQKLRAKMNERNLDTTTTTEARHLIAVEETAEGYVLTFAKAQNEDQDDDQDDGGSGGGGGDTGLGDGTSVEPTGGSDSPTIGDTGNMTIQPVKNPKDPGLTKDEDQDHEIRDEVEEHKHETMNQIERRYLTPDTKTIEIRYHEDDEEHRVEGYAAVFNSPTTIQGRTGAFREQIARSAFEGRLDDPVVALFNHDQLRPLSKVGAGLELSVDDYGLRYSFPIPDTTTGRDLVELMKRGVVREASFAFTIAPGGESWTRSEGDEMETRTISKVGRLIDVSVVTLGAYSDASAALRQFEAAGADDLPLEVLTHQEQRENTAEGPKTANRDHIQKQRDRIRRAQIFKTLQK
jgi:HK97 family phage prohead protease